MAKDRFTEHTVSSEQVFDGGLLKVWRDRVRRDGEDGEWTREYISHPGATVIVAVTDAGKILLERQYRYPLRRVMIELPAGKIDPGEAIDVCARRELQEETGFVARDWLHLGTMHPCVGYSDERIEMFLAQGLEYVGHHFDHGEYLEVLEWSLEEAEQAIHEGRISDGKSVTALFHARRYLQP